MRSAMSPPLSPLKKAAIALVWCLIGPLPSARAQEPSAEVARRLAALEAENAALRGRIEVLEAREPAAGSEALDLEDVVSSTLEAVSEEALSAPSMGSRYQEVTATFQLYGDVGFRFADPGPGSASETTFSFGSQDLFMTARIGDHFQVLSETVLEGDPADNEIVLDQERLWGAYRFFDELYLKFGMEHSPIVRWNRSFHHGKWLFLGTDRPFLGAFEDDEGIMPSHFAGLEIGGSFTQSWGEVSYVAVLSNGRGALPTDRQLVLDSNDSKAVTLAFEISPEFVSGLTLGAAFRNDNIPASPGDPQRRASISEQIYTAFLEYNADAWDIRAEGALLVHRDHTSGRRFRHGSGYIQVGYRIDDFTPFARFDFRSMSRGDPFFAPANSDLDAWVQTVGVRWDFVDNAALTLEAAFGRRELRSEDGSIHRSGFVGIAMQLAWYF